MSVELNFWKYQNGLYLDNTEVYQQACCEHENVDGLEVLPITSILQETAAAFPDWTSPAPLHYEGREHGSFQITTTPQTVRFDCYSMELADMRRFSSILSKFGCPLYDPQLGVRFDKIIAFLIDDAAQYKAKAEQELSRLLPGVEIVTRSASWEEYTQHSKALGHPEYNALIHRAKTLTKVTSFMRTGSIRTNRPCQCKTAQLSDSGQEHHILEEMLQKSISKSSPMHPATFLNVEPSKVYFNCCRVIYFLP